MGWRRIPPNRFKGKLFSFSSKRGKDLRGLDIPPNPSFSISQIGRIWRRNGRRNYSFLSLYYTCGPLN
jgi:hypothetical protein